jgi:hypothetical protein
VEEKCKERRAIRQRGEDWQVAREVSNDET